MPVTASAEASHRSAATARFGVSAAYLLNEADIAPCGRDSASLRPFLSAGTEKALSLPKLGVHLISRAVRPRKTAASTYSHEEQHDDQFHTYLPLVP
jgi:hypothetical protein